MSRVFAPNGQSNTAMAQTENSIMELIIIDIPKVWLCCDSALCHTIIEARLNSE